VSWKASAFVLDLADRTTPAELSAMHIAVLHALAARHNDRDYHCSFGQLRRMAQDTHMHVTTLSLLLSELEDKGVISVWEGQLPARRDDPSDARRTRGTMWCFIGLDDDAGPNIAGAEPRVKRGGRPKTELAHGKLSLPDELAVGEKSVSPNGKTEFAGKQLEQADEFAGPISPINRSVKPDTKPINQTSRAHARESHPLCPNCGRAIDHRGRGHGLEDINGHQQYRNCRLDKKTPGQWPAALARASPAEVSA
jgi:hypothetical protein